MNYTGSVRKMRTEITNETVSYFLPIGQSEVHMNDYIGKSISFIFQNKINCIKCGCVTNKSFAQGFCYPCFTTAPETEECVLRPELCKAHEGISRDMEHAEKHCLRDQYVYLAVSSGLKVGVTRHIPSRWVDQGASYALVIAVVPNRYTAGVIEVALKTYFSDKTNWQKMLKNEVLQGIDLVAERERAKLYLPGKLQQYFLKDNDITHIHYPVEKYPVKVDAVNFDKSASFSGILSGIKGQYLIFSNGMVLNVRKYTGYNFMLKV